MARFEHAFVVRAPLERVWAFHDDPLALPKVMSSLLRMHVHHVDRPLSPGSRILMTMQVGPLRQRWNVQIKERVPPHYFTDEQIGAEGPFKRWRHTHAFEALDDAHTRVIDRLEYELPLGLLGRLADALFGRIVMTATFAARARATRRWLETK